MTVIDFTVYLDKVLKDQLNCNVRYTETDASFTIEEQENSDSKESQQSPMDVECYPVLKILKECVLGKQPRHLLLSGQPGSGKSTTLKQLLLEIAKTALLDINQPVPVFLQLKGNKSIRELIVDEFKRAKLKVTLEQIDDLLLEDKLILLLDGVNEIPTDDLRRQLHDFREDYFSTPMIFTTRGLSVCCDLGIEQRLEMSPLTESQMWEFVPKYLPESGIELLRQLQYRLMEIAKTPLLLKMLCDIFDPVTQEIPKSKGSLFLAFDRKYVQLKQRAPVYGDFHRFRSELLAHLAFVMIQGDPQKPTEAWFTISCRQAELILEEWLNIRGVIDAPTKAKRWLENLIEHDLLQIAADVEQVEFHHQLFQEFYAAKKLLEMLDSKDSDLINDERLQHFYLNYLKWTESISLMLSMLDNEIHALRIVELALAVDKILGSRFAGEVKPELQRKTLSVINMLDVPKWLRVKLLDITNSHEAIPILLNLLKSKEPSIRREIVRVIGKEKSNDNIISHLLKTLEDIDVSVRKSTVKVLAKANHQLVIPNLIKALEDEHSSIRKCAAHALGEMGSKLATSNLLNMLEDNNLSVRKVVEKALEKISVDSNIIIISESSSATIDNSCAIQVVPMLEYKSGIADLSRMIKSPDKSIRLSVVKSLKNIDSQTAISMLARSLENEDSWVRRRAAEILGIIGSEAAIPALITALEDEETWVQRRSVEALGLIGSTIVIPVLIAKLVDKDSWVRRRSAEALGLLGSPLAIPSLLQALEDSEPIVRGGAAIALGQIGDEKTIYELIKLLTDETKWVRGRAAESLENFNSKRAAHILPTLQSLILNESGEEAFRALIIIQAKCQFYNYSIFRTAPVVTPLSSPIVYPIYNIERVGNLNTGTVKVNGDMIGESRKIFVRPLLKR